MKKRLHFFSVLVLTFFLSKSFSQTFQVGHVSTSFTDPSRSNRSITAEIYYPANTAGNNVPIASGQFPVVVFGHGFIMVWSCYNNIWTDVVPYGYIMVFPTTETTISPSHLDFGKDIAFLVGAMKAQGLNSSSTFYGAVTNKSAVMGHSMGGGSAFLSVQFDSSITALASLAAANTTPSAITAAKNIAIPSIVFSGGNDCVAPSAQNQKPMYDSLISTCKTFVSITGGSHCQFANSNTNCSFGEATCTPSPTITPTVQQGIVNQLLVPWLNYYLKNDCNSGTQFQSLITASSGITSQQNCTLSCATGVGNIVEDKLSAQIMPNPFNSETTVTIQNTNGKIQNSKLILYDVYGREVINLPISSSTIKLERGNLPSGIYFYKIMGDNISGVSGKIIVE